MTAAGTWLERFRRPAGVPEAAADELGSELMPVFARLDRIEEEARRLRLEAEDEAARRLAAAKAAAARAGERWRVRADAERARAEARGRKDAADAADALERAGRQEAEALRVRGLARVPALVSEVLACIEERSS